MNWLVEFIAYVSWFMETADANRTMHGAFLFENLESRIHVQVNTYINLNSEFRPSHPLLLRCCAQRSILEGIRMKWSRWTSARPTAAALHCHIINMRHYKRRGYLIGRSWPSTARKPNGGDSLFTLTGTINGKYFAVTVQYFENPGMLAAFHV
jgi:hypothetical protein